MSTEEPITDPIELRSFQEHRYVIAGTTAPAEPDRDNEVVFLAHSADTMANAEVVHGYYWTLNVYNAEIVYETEMINLARVFETIVGMSPKMKCLADFVINIRPVKLSASLSPVYSHFLETIRRKKHAELMEKFKSTFDENEQKLIINNLTTGED